MGAAGCLSYVGVVIGCKLVLRHDDDDDDDEGSKEGSEAARFAFRKSQERVCFFFFLGTGTSGSLFVGRPGSSSTGKAYVE